MSEADPRALVRRVLHATEQLPHGLRDEILGLGRAAVPDLICMLEDPDADWGSIHAAGLLGELAAPEAIEPMLRVLRQTHWQDIVHDRIITSLPRIGPAVVEPALHAIAEDKDPDFRSGVASILARTHMRDDRILEVLLAQLREDPVMGACDLAEYGDASAIPYLHEAFDRYEVVNVDSAFANQAAIELREAIEELGGAMRPDQERKYELAMRARTELRRKLAAAIEGGGHEINKAAATRRRDRPGRNDACWCGSGKKYKKCHLSEEEGAATGSPA